jgi:hypothetical protein
VVSFSAWGILANHHGCPSSDASDASVVGVEHEVEALSGIEQKGHAFPLVWVNRPLVSGEFEPMPWPADAVRVTTDG